LIGCLSFGSLENGMAKRTAQKRKAASLTAAEVECRSADNIIQEREAELLPAIADALDCPIPPFVSMQPDATAA
jgi:hypothetical protein